MNRRVDLLGGLVLASKDVKAGEEIAIDYHELHKADDEEFDNFLKHMCSDEKEECNTTKYHLVY